MAGLHRTYTIRCDKANKAYAASAPQHKHRCAADQAAFYPIAPRCNRAWVHFKQIGRLKSTHWFHSYMKQALSRVCRTNSPPLKAEHFGAFLVHRQAVLQSRHIKRVKQISFAPVLQSDLPIWHSGIVQTIGNCRKNSSALSDGLPHQRPRSGVHAGNKRQARPYINAQPWRRHHTLFVSHLCQRFHMLRCTAAACIKIATLRVPLLPQGGRHRSRFGFIELLLRHTIVKPLAPRTKHHE